MRRRTRLARVQGIFAVCVDTLPASAGGFNVEKSIFFSCLFIALHFTRRFLVVSEVLILEVFFGKSLFVSNVAAAARNFLTC